MQPAKFSAPIVKALKPRCRRAETAAVSVGSMPGATITADGRKITPSTSRQKPRTPIVPMAFARRHSAPPRNAG